MIEHIYWYDYCNAKGFGTCSWKLRTPPQLKGFFIRNTPYPRKSDIRDAKMLTGLA